MKSSTPAPAAQAANAAEIQVMLRQCLANIVHFDALKQRFLALFLRIRCGVTIECGEKLAAELLPLIALSESAMFAEARKLAEAYHAQ